MHKRATGLVVLGLTSLGLVGGCGGDDERALTKADYLSQGNSICAATNARLDEAGRSAFPQQGIIPPPEQIERFVDQTAEPEFDRMLGRLKELKPPETDKDIVEDVLEWGQKSLESMRNDPTSVQSNVQGPFLQFDARASGYGLTECRTGQKLQELTNGIRKQ